MAGRNNTRRENRDKVDRLLQNAQLYFERDVEFSVDYRRGQGWRFDCNGRYLSPRLGSRDFIVWLEGFTEALWISRRAWRR